MIEWIDETSEQLGTEFSRKNMMAIQGFEAITTTFNDDGSITETNANGHTLKTTFNNDGSITEIFTGEKTITKNIIFNTNNSVSEVIS